MNYQEIIKAICPKINGEIDSNEITVLVNGLHQTVPGSGMQDAGVTGKLGEDDVRFKFLEQDDLLIMVARDLPGDITLKEQDSFSSLLDFFHLLPEHKVGIPEMDDRFIIRAESEETAKAFFTDEVLDLLKAMGSIHSLNLAHGMCTLHKKITEEFTADEAMKELEALVKVADIVEKSDQGAAQA